MGAQMNVLIRWRQPVKCHGCGQTAQETTVSPMYVDLAVGSRIFCPHCNISGLFEKEYMQTAEIHFTWGRFIVTDENGEHEELRKVYNARNLAKKKSIDVSC
jgi:hypothetical protein